MLSRGRPYTLIKATTNVVFGTAILLYGYQTPTLTILFSASQISDGDTLKTNFNELLNFYQRLITSGAYNHDIELLKNDPNHIGNNLLLLWQHGVKTGDVKRIQVLLQFSIN